MDGTRDHTNEATFDLGLELASPGRRPTALSPVIVRPLEDADLALLSVSRGTSPVAVKKLSDRHHGLARLIAAGVGPGEAAIAMRYDRGRVSVLLSDPAFEELVAFYRHKQDVTFQATLEQIQTLGASALEELQSRIEDEPESFEVRELREIARDMLDRSGHGPSSTQVQTLNLTLSTRLEAARERALAVRKDVVEAEVVETPEGTEE